MRFSDTTVILPVKHEPAAGMVAKEILKRLPGCRLVVVYKGSRSVLGISFADRRMKIIEQHDSGKGNGVRQALAYVDTEIVCLIDGDGTYAVDDLKKAIGMVRKGADMAVGNRFANLDRRAMPFYIELGNRIITQTANLLYGLRLSDSQTGLRAIRKRALDTIGTREEGFGIESELNIRFRKAGFSVEEHITIIAYSPLAHGALFSSRYSGFLEELSGVGERYGKTAAQVALNWLVSKNGVVPIPKASGRGHVTEIAGSCGWRMSRKDYGAVSAFLSGRRRRSMARIAGPAIKHLPFAARLAEWAGGRRNKRA